MVVNGYGAVSTSARVAALKKVDFPVEGLPTIPINILTQIEFKFLMVAVKKFFII
jgi:hypothetical protein